MTDPLDAALRGFAAADRVLVALDFDGTLAPHVDHPEDARALPASRAAVRRLLDCADTAVAFISGRALASLTAVADPPPEVLLVGSHGVEARLEPGHPESTLDDDELRRVRELGELLERVAAPLEGVWVEVKPAGFALHTRAATAAVAADAEREARDRALAEFDGLTVRGGKHILEFSVRATTKGDSVRMLRARTGADAVFFAGDDVTDEDGFRALEPGDVGVKVGDGETAAAFRVASPEAFAELLGRLADLRAAR